MKTYGNIPKTLLKACQKHADKIEEIGNEGDDGYWIYLKQRFYNPIIEAHCIHEYTVKACIDQLPSIIVEHRIELPSDKTLVVSVNQNHPKA